MMNKKIGFIGCGNMGKALLAGFIRSNQVSPQDVLVYNRTTERQQALHAEFGCYIATSPQEVAHQADIIIIGVKPGTVIPLLKAIGHQWKPGGIVVSIAAGVTLQQLQQALPPEHKVVRVMPNTPALVQTAMCSVTPNAWLTPAECDEILELLQSIGEAVLIPESLIHAVIGVSGSAPAYVFMFIEAMADAAVWGGMPRHQAYQFAAQAVLGAAKMVLETGRHPGELKDMVCSPGGTTIEAVQALEEKGLRSAVITAVQQCIKKSQQLE